MFEKVRTIGDVQTVEMYGKEYPTTKCTGECAKIHGARHNGDGTCCISKQSPADCIYRDDAICWRLRMEKQYDTLFDKLRNLFGKRS